MAIVLGTAAPGRANGVRTLTPPVVPPPPRLVAPGPPRLVVVAGPPVYYGRPWAL